MRPFHNVRTVRKRQSPLAWFWVGTKASRAGRGADVSWDTRPKLCRMLITAIYAARTPRPTDIMTVRQRMTGIKSEITFQPPLRRSAVCDALAATYVYLSYQTWDSSQVLQFNRVDAR